LLIIHLRCVDAKSRALDVSKLNNWPRNSGRRSFASYRIAYHEDLGKLAMPLSHPDPSLLFKHYRQLVTVKAAKTYWSIAPADSSDITNIKNA